MISPQPHPALLAGVLKQIFRAAVRQVTTLASVRCAVCGVRCAVCSARCAVRGVQCSTLPLTQDQQSMLTEWVLVSLPNFTRRAPLSHSIWFDPSCSYSSCSPCFSCFLLPAPLSLPGASPAFSWQPPPTPGCRPCSPTCSTDSQVAPPILPGARHPPTSPGEAATPHEDKRLFCLAAADFYTGLQDRRQQEKFIQVPRSCQEY